MPSKLTHHDILNLVGGFLWGYGGCAFVCFLIFTRYWIGHAPVAPDPIMGFVYPHNEHGSITYFTAFEATSASLLFATSIPLAFVGFFLTRKKNIKSKSSRFGFHMTFDKDDPRKLAKVGSICGAIAAPLLLLSVGTMAVKSLNAAGVAWNF